MVESSLLVLENRIDQIGGHLSAPAHSRPVSTMDVPGFALITGAVSGIGRACAKGFAAEGSAGVALLDMNLKDLQAVQSEVQAISPTCQAVVHQVNVTDEQQVDKIVDEVAQRFGRLEYVVNAAGVAMKHQGGVAFAETSDWKRILDSWR